MGLVADKTTFSLSLPAHPTEFGTERPPLEVLGARPKAGLRATTGLLVITLGFATPPENPFYRKLRQALADLYDLVVLGVSYLGTRAKRTRTLHREVDVEPLLKRVVARHGRDGLRRCTTPDGLDFAAVLDTLRGEDLSDHVHLTEVFTGQDATDYVDFGFVAAVDVIWAIHGVLERHPLLDRSRIHLVGSSLGATLVQQALRCAPHTFASVLDISGKPLLDDGYLLHGRTRKALVGRFNTLASLTNASLYQNDDPSAPFFLDAAMRQVRDQTRPLPPIDGDPPLVQMVTGIDDTIVPVAHKEAQLQGLLTAGAEASLTVITGDDVDGVVIKHAGHALGAEFYQLVRRFDDQALRSRTRQTADDFARGGDVALSESWTLTYDGGPPRLRRIP